MTSGSLTVDLNAIRNNWIELNKFSSTNVKTSAVLKANAYGIGMENVACELEKIGVNIFFVATIEEGKTLRKLVKNNCKIYLLNGCEKYQEKEIIENNLIPVLVDKKTIYYFNNLKIKFAIQIEIGMNRLGIHKLELIKIRNEINLKNLDLLLGHLSSADNKNSEENLKQYENFNSLKSYFDGIPFSLAATAGILLNKKFHYNLTRPGIGLYGGFSFPGYQNVISLSLPILQIKVINKGEGVGYNHSYIAKKTSRIAIVSGGYADGLLRTLTNGGALFHNNIRCPIIGKVSMDLITVDLSNVNDNPKRLFVVNEFQSLEDIAKSAKTISYEILTSLSKRYNRTYNV